MLTFPKGIVRSPNVDKQLHHFTVGCHYFRVGLLHRVRVMVTQSPDNVTTNARGSLALLNGQPAERDANYDVTFATEEGCECRTKWDFEGGTYWGCQNVDASTNGDWCITEGSCGTQLRDDRSTYWDYCTPDKTIVANSEACKCKEEWNWSSNACEGATFYGRQPPANGDGVNGLMLTCCH
jgi:hypothetical protein